VFQHNVDTYPSFANVYDSLAEAYVAAGDTTRAVESYRKALAINPRSKSARYALQRLTGERRPLRPLLLFHIFAGVVGLLSGATAMALRKGSRRHEIAGQVFVVAMLCMGSSATYMAVMDPLGDVINVLMGILAFAVVAMLAAVGDIRMLARGGITGARRIARHLWRMSTALFIAVASFFLGQAQVFPDVLRQSAGLRAIPVLLVIASLIFWLVRVRFTAAYGSRATPPKPANRPSLTTA
jgi:uncharacterized membrane protein